MCNTTSLIYFLNFKIGTKHSWNMTFKVPLLSQSLVLLSKINETLRWNCCRSSYTDSLRSNNNDHPGASSGQGKQTAQAVTSSLDINKEKRTQKFLLLILISHFLCILPIHVVKWVKRIFYEKITTWIKNYLFFFSSSGWSIIPWLRRMITTLILISPSSSVSGSRFSPRWVHFNEKKRRHCLFQN